MKRKNIAIVGISILAFVLGNSAGALLHIDHDQDGYAVSRFKLLAFGEQDCNDNDPAINPAATEIPNNQVDEDCREGDLTLPENLLDGDGDGYTPSGGDCNDLDRSVHPQANEVKGDGIDSDCDSQDSVNEEKTLLLMKDVGTPMLEKKGRNSTEFTKYIGGKVLLVPEQLKSAKLSVTVNHDGITNNHEVPEKIGVVLYVQTDVSHGQRDYWEYDSKLGTAFKKLKEGGCSGELVGSDEFILYPYQRSTKTLPLIDLSSAPLAYDKNNPDANWPCDQIRDRDILSLINAASKYGKSVKIGLYTTAPTWGWIVEAKLIYEGQEITIVNP